MVRMGETSVQRIDIMLEYEMKISNFDNAVVSQEKSLVKDF